DVTRLQALVKKKKIVVSEAVIHEILQLNDAEGVVCLPNEEIFIGLAQMGYEKPSTKLTFYKAFFSSQWKFLIHTILQSLSAKRTSWNEFSTTMASAVICISKGQKFNFSKYILTAWVGKGFSGVETPLFEGMLAVGQPAEEGLVVEQVQVDDAVAAVVEENVAEDVSHAAIPSPPPHDISSLSQKPSSPPHQQQSSPQAPPQDTKFPTQLQQVLNLKARVKKLEKANKSTSSKLRRLRKVGASRRVESSNDMEDVFNQGRMIDDMDMDERIELVKDAEVIESEGRHAEKQAEIYNLDLDHSSKVLSMQEDDSEVQEVVEVVTNAKLITEVVTATASQVSAASTTIPAASATIPAAKPTIPAAAPSVIAAYTRLRKRVIITDPEEELPLKTPAETPKVKDKGKGILVETPKPLKKKDQIKMDAEYAKKLQEEINKNYEKYQGMKKIPQTESEARKNMKIYLKNTAGYKMDFFKGMTYAQICPIFQARFDENIRFLFKSREEMEAEDQEIIKSINETPVQKEAKRRKLSKEAQEAKDLRKRLEEPDRQDAIWRNQKSVHGLALVKRWKLLASCGVHVITLLTVQLFLLVKRREEDGSWGDHNPAPWHGIFRWEIPTTTTYGPRITKVLR
nr:hypothetical protein [Tanacetum cinerariifolium]